MTDFLSHRRARLAKSCEHGFERLVEALFEEHRTHAIAEYGNAGRLKYLIGDAPFIKFTTESLRQKRRSLHAALALRGENILLDRSPFIIANQTFTTLLIEPRNRGVIVDLLAGYTAPARRR
jgi:hypothetical protein